HNLSNSKLKLYPEAEYNDHGELKVPLWYWGLILFQVRGWWLVWLGEFIADPGSAPLAFLYPNTLSWLLSLAQGVPGLLILFCYPLRGRFPRLVKWSYLFLLAGALFGLVVNSVYLYHSTTDDFDLWGCLLGFDIASLGALILSIRLVDVFGWRQR
ncbi:MAG: DUF2919 family protein, partial [Enterobacteriaceae bacterium]